MAGRWQFWIDRGGTFTDCIGISPEGETRVRKVPSSDVAPLVGIRAILGLGEDAEIPACTMRLGTTLATNALLERKGAKTALLITKGFEDLLAIGTQERPELFALEIQKSPPLPTRVVGVDSRYSAQGELLTRHEPAALREELRSLRAEGVESLAIAVLHSYLDTEEEEAIAELAREVGFTDLSLTSVVGGELGLLPRADTTTANAYLGGPLRRYLGRLTDELPGTQISIMQSSGGLAGKERVLGKDVILSGPAGGVLACEKIAEELGEPKLIGFDMGGTSTDVSCIDGRAEKEYECVVAGVRVRAPMLKIHTVAAGGGSICSDNGTRMLVGPESAGALPGPLCYGNPKAKDIAITDCNLLLGRLIPDLFPIELNEDAPRAAMDKLCKELAERGQHKDIAEIAQGFVEIANATMADAIREVTNKQGLDARDFAMLVFGGAGGQHACAVAEVLGIRRVIFEPLGGVFSALGIGISPQKWTGTRDAGGASLNGATTFEDDFKSLEEEGKKALRNSGVTEAEVQRFLDLRYRGTQSAITIAATENARQHFQEEHESRYGYQREDGIEVVALRVEVSGGGETGRAVSDFRAQPENDLRESSTKKVYTGRAWEEIPVRDWRAQEEGAEIVGPMVLFSNTGTIFVSAGWSGKVGPGGRLILASTHAEESESTGDTKADPIRLEIFHRRFMSIASQMGASLRNTAVSTNIRERLDFSCAVFDAEGGLVANAPHIPVHLGAMGESVRGVMQEHPQAAPGSVFATNDPSLGGSHLPDITVVTPVHDEQGVLRFFTASRGHHSDVGGITPGSMPPFSTRLSEEGVVLRAVQIVRAGRLDDKRLEELLRSGAHPCRDPEQVIADLRAQIAANRFGEKLLREFTQKEGNERVLAYMQHIQDAAYAECQRAIAELAEGTCEFSDEMDDGSRICVAIRIADRRMSIDFANTSPQVEGNLNAPRAITVAAVMYVLRAMIGKDIPLNSGCMRAVDLKIPEGCILAPSAERAVVAGNVETSQRVVDVLLGALELAAASQGTMNNLSFGNRAFGYYETIAGGAGATKSADGASGVHTHMTNTRITDPEILERRFPVRLHEFSLRKGSGGNGAHRGGDGLVREFECLEPLEVSIISQRRTRSPFGLHGGEAGKPGANWHNGEPVEGCCRMDAAPGDRIRVETPGGGGYGPPEK